MNPTEQELQDIRERVEFACGVQREDIEFLLDLVGKYRAVAEKLLACKKERLERSKRDDPYFDPDTAIGQEPDVELYLAAVEEAQKVIEEAEHAG